MKNISTLSALMALMLTTFDLNAQDTARSNIIFQVEKNSKFKEKIITNDTATLFVEYAFDSLSFKLEQYPARVFGDKSIISIELPDSILKNAQYIKISSPTKVACLRCPASADYVSLLDNNYKPFDFYFNSTPTGADLYLIPLYNCKAIFNTTDFNKIKINPSVLENINAYKVSISPTPLTFKVVSQPYVAIFSFFDIVNNTTKLTKELIRPNKDFPKQNKVTSFLR